MPDLFLLATPIVRSLTEYVENTFSATSERRKSPGFNLISSGTFLALPLAAHKERDDRKMTNRIETLTIETLKRSGDRRTSQKSANGKRRNK
jgi:hypothetical protein